MSVSVVILAAGAGTRMKSPTPKVLHRISGKEMLYYAIKEALKISDDVSVVLYHQATRVQDAMEHYFPNVRFVLQDHENFPGTGGAVMAAAPQCDDVLILNGDMPLVEEGELRKFLGFDADAVMSVLDLADASGYGRVVTHEGCVLRIVEQKDATPEEKAIRLANAGVYLFKKKYLETYLPLLDNNNAQKEYYLTDLIAMGVKDAKKIAYTVVNETHFKGVNSKRDLAEAESLMQDKIRNFWMEQGVIMHLPATIFIEEGATFVGECELECGVVIKGDSHIERSIVKAHSVIENGVLIDSDVGPMARIRPKSRLEEAHVGNFVEVKNAHLKAGVKAGHLSYIGDATVGERTNIGAGTITCNYDGINKYHTTIEEDVFIGSDTQLVAPVVVKKGAMIAAGTTVTHDVEEGSLAISRTRQSAIAGFREKFFRRQSKH